MSSMNLEEAERAMDKVIRLGGNYGASAENNKVAAFINKITRKRFAEHKTPSGIPWPMTQTRKVRIGDTAIVGRDRRPGSARSGKRIIRKVKTPRELAAVNARRPGPLKALSRGGKYPAKKLRNAYTKKSAPGHIQAAGRTSLTIGSSWRMAAGLQFGLGKPKVPAREFYGITEKDMEIILNIYLVGYMFQIEKITGSKIKFKDFARSISANSDQ